MPESPGSEAFYFIWLDSHLEPADPARADADLEGSLWMVLSGGFYTSVNVTFEVTDAGQHHHVPLLVSPFGYTTYRGS